MTVSAHQEVIATLIELAERGEIDPWNVSVIEVIDRFLQDLGILESLDLAFQQKNLPRSGQAFLWASLLVRCKADTLTQSPPEPEAVLVETEILPNSESSGLPSHLENHLRRRTAIPPLRQRRVTLPELIQQIREISAEIEKSEQTPKKIKRNRPQSRREAVQAIAELAHQENLTALAVQLEQFLQNLCPHHPCPWIDLSTLLEQWHQQYPFHSPACHEDKVGIFWALLLLSSQSKVALAQDEFYQDLRVQLLDVNSVGKSP